MAKDKRFSRLWRQCGGQSLLAPIRNLDWTLNRDVAKNCLHIPEQGPQPTFLKLERGRSVAGRLAVSRRRADRGRGAEPRRRDHALGPEAQGRRRDRGEQIVARGIASNGESITGAEPDRKKAPRTAARAGC
jgi:hypothetical protein